MENLDLKRHGTPHIHVLRETEHKGNGAFFDWLAVRHPDVHKLFRFSAATDRILQPWDGASLYIPWLQDPVRERDPILFEKASVLEAAYGARGIPVVNPVAVLSNAIKSRALPLMRQGGANTARTALVSAALSFDAIADAVGAPFILRNDQGHGGYIRLIHEPAELHEVRWDLLPNPLAVEFIDTRGPDGLYRKYRLLFTGGTSIARHLIITPSWSAHADDRLQGGAYLEEEMAFLTSPSPHHALLDNVRQALGLDYVAFDFSITPDGEPVVWEPNPYPVLWGRANEVNPEYNYQRPQMDAIFSNVLRFYLERARLLHVLPTSHA